MSKVGRLLCEGESFVSLLEGFLLYCSCCEATQQVLHQPVTQGGCEEFGRHILVWLRKKRFLPIVPGPAPFNIKTALASMLAGPTGIPQRLKDSAVIRSSALPGTISANQRIPLPSNFWSRRVCMFF